MSALADYLLRFTSAEAATAWSPPAGATLNPVKAYSAEAVFGPPDPVTGDRLLISPRIEAAGYWMQVFVAEKTDAIRDMPECIARGYRSNGWNRSEADELGIVAIDGLFLGSAIGR